MASNTEESVVCRATPAEVLDVIADVESYPQWSSDIRRVEVLHVGDDGLPAEVEFTVSAGIISDTYVLAYTWDVDEHGEGLVSWTLVRSGALRALDGSYELIGEDAGTRVTYRLAVDLLVPLPGLMRRKAQKTIVSTALSGLTRRVEG